MSSFGHHKTDIFCQWESLCINYLCVTLQRRVCPGGIAASRRYSSDVTAMCANFSFSVFSLICPLRVNCGDVRGPRSRKWSDQGVSRGELGALSFVFPLLQQACIFRKCHKNLSVRLPREVRSRPWGCGLFRRGRINLH